MHTIPLTILRDLRDSSRTGPLEAIGSRVHYYFQRVFLLISAKSRVTRECERHPSRTSYSVLWTSRCW
ncbi:hypothetical protein OPQ81_001419 [Rhizoctonia solani]|nr:hypothetical protein OPQ81_001419 [Rhizoctonia solani]